jgi:fibronectin-binding autotransporter adhesin
MRGRACLMPRTVPVVRVSSVAKLNGLSFRRLTGTSPSLFSLSLRGLLATAMLLAASSAPATDRYWSGSLDDWTTSIDWTGHTVPSSSDYAYIGNGGTAIVSLPGAACSNLRLGWGQSGTIQMTNGSLTVGNTLFVGSSVTGTFTQSGGTNTILGTLYLGSYPGITGTYNLNGGTLALRQIALGPTYAFNFNGGTLKALGPFSLSLSLPISLNTPGGNATIDSNGYSVLVFGLLSGPGSLMKAGNGTLRLDNSSNSYGGETIISAGTLQLGIANAIPSGSVVTDNGTFDVSGLSCAIGGLAGGGYVNGTYGAPILTIGGSGTNTFAGVIQNSGATSFSVQYNGSALQILTGNNTYTGETTITAGTLALATSTSNNNIGYSAKILVGDTSAHSGAVFDVAGVTTAGGFQSYHTLAGFGTVRGSVSICDTLNAGDVGVVGTLNAENVTFASGSTFRLDLDGATADRLHVTGTATIANSPKGGSKIDFNTINPPTAGMYVLLTSGSGNLGGQFSGTAPANYRLSYATNELDLVHKATIAADLSAPAAMITGGSIAVSGHVANTAPTGSDPLNYMLGGPTGISGLPSGALAQSAGDSGVAAGTYFSGSFTSSTLGTNSVAVTVTAADGNVTNGPQQAAGTSVTVFDHANASLAADTNQSSQVIDFGNVLRGASVTSQTFSVYNRAANTTAANTADLKLTGWTADGDAALGANLAAFSGLAAGHANAYTASLSTANYTTTGVSTLSMPAGQLADDSPLVGAGPNNNGGIVVTLRANVGNATADASNLQTAFGPPLTAPVAANAGYAKLESGATTVSGNGGYGLTGSTATILAGTNCTGLDQLVSMSWRTQTQEERATSAVFSDIVNLSGMTINGSSRQTAPFVLQFTYDPALLLSANELPYLGWQNPSTGIWENAVDGNFGTNSGKFYLGAWPDGDMTLGDYGVDTASHTVWAVLNHNSQFAAVPEPSTFVLLGVGAIGLLAYAWRRRNRTA